MIHCGSLRYTEVSCGALWPLLQQHCYSSRPGLTAGLMCLLGSKHRILCTTQVAGAIRAVEEGGIEYTIIHNTCNKQSNSPGPISVTNLYPLSSFFLVLTGIVRCYGER